MSMKNPDKIDEMLSVLLSKEQKEWLKFETEAGYSRIAALRLLLNIGVTERKKYYGRV
jgi:hypothetical protein